MKVYIVSAGYNHEGADPEAAFFDKEKAEQKQAELAAIESYPGGKKYDYVEIIELDVS